MGKVTIHVFDEARGVQQDFTCDMATLLKSMRYFKGYLRKVAPNQDVEISVHCDVAVFAWLLRYAKMEPGPERPALGLGNCLPVLISSNFLQMEELVEDCILFVSENLSKVVALPLDMSSLADELHLKLAKIVAEEKLEALWKKCTTEHSKGDDDKRVLLLVNKLYKNKLEHMLRAVQSTLARCVHCKHLFSAVHRSKLTCASANTLVDYRGNIVAQHSPEPRWRFQKYLADLRKAGHSWRSIYWHTWGHVNLLYCKVCQRHFPVSHMGHCTYHPRSAVFPNSKSSGTYPCCGAPAFRFDTTQVVRQGCSARSHEVELDYVPGSGDITKAEHDRVLHLLSMYEELVLIPWDGPSSQGLEDGRGMGQDVEDEDEDDAGDFEEPSMPAPRQRVPSARRQRAPQSAKRVPAREGSARVGRKPVSAGTARAGTGTDAASNTLPAGDSDDSDSAAEAPQHSAAGSIGGSTGTDSDSDDALSMEGDFKVLRGHLEESDVGMDRDDYELEAPPSRSYLASIGVGKYTDSIRTVTENGNSRVKPYLQAALFQELIRQDDADRMQELMENLAMYRSGPVRKPSQAQGQAQQQQQRPRTATSRVASANRPMSAGGNRASSARPKQAFR